MNVISFVKSVAHIYCHSIIVILQRQVGNVEGKKVALNQYNEHTA